MNAHREILAKAAAKQLPDPLDDSSDVSVEAVKELVEAGYLKAIDASSMDGDAFLEPRITAAGREYLARLERETKDNSLVAKGLRVTTPVAKWVWSIVTAVLIGLILFWLTGK
jgi:hypothetical protein